MYHAILSLGHERNQKIGSKVTAIALAPNKELFGAAYEGEGGWLGNLFERAGGKRLDCLPPCSITLVQTCSSSDVTDQSDIQSLKSPD